MALCILQRPRQLMDPWIPLGFVPFRSLTLQQSALHEGDQFPRSTGWCIMWRKTNTTCSAPRRHLTLSICSRQRFVPAFQFRVVVAAYWRNCLSLLKSCRNRDCEGLRRSRQREMLTFAHRDAVLLVRIPWHRARSAKDTVEMEPSFPT